MPIFTSNTAFVLVPGGFCPGAYFHKVTSLLEKDGYEVAQIDLPGVGKRDGPPATMYDDAEYVRTKALQFADQGKDVVLAGNSYGGIVITEAAKNISKADREAVGKPGGVVHLVYLASGLAPVGISTQKLVADKVPVMMETDVEYNEPLDAATAGALLCSDMSKEDQLFYGAMQRPHSAAAFHSKLTYAGWQHIPTTVVIAELDKTLASSFLHENVDRVIAKGEAKGEAKVTKISVQAQHCMMLNRPEAVVEILLGQPPA